MRRRSLIMLVLLVLTVTGTAGAAYAGSGQATGVPGGSRGYVLRNGRTAPVFSYAHAIRQTAFVTYTGADGTTVRVAADIIRPRELDHVARIPVIMEASPYYSCCGRGNQDQVKTYTKDGRPREFPLFYDNFFEPRGYAVVLVDMPGTNRSGGCSDEGGPQDVDPVKAVVRWLGGHGTAVGLNGKPATAYWSNGSVGMIGKSYDGTLANAVAATGVTGLKTIVPISAISSWYDYDRAQGLPFSYDYPTYLSETVEQDRTEKIDCTAVNDELSRHDADRTGAYTRFWRVRDYRAVGKPDAAAVKASVFLVHGLEDTNVKMINAASWLAALRAHGVITKVWLSRLGHTDPFDYDRANWVSTLHLWFDNQLLGIHNGVLKQPPVRVEVGPGVWRTSASWPVATRTNILHPAKHGRLGERRGRGAASFTNDADQSEAQAVALGANAHRLQFLTAALARSVRISGTPRATLTVTDPAVTGQLAVALVDYGAAVRVPDDGEGNVTREKESCWGLSTTYDSACYFNSVEARQKSPYQVLARGWARLPAARQRLTVKLAPNDVRVQRGHRLGLVVYSASPEWAVVLDRTAGEYSVNLRSARLTIPTLGALRFGGAATQPERAPQQEIRRTDPARRLPY